MKQQFAITINSLIYKACIRVLTTQLLTINQHIEFLHKNIANKD